MYDIGRFEADRCPEAMRRRMVSAEKNVKHRPFS